MTQLTKEEREALLALGEDGLRQPDLPRSLRLVLPTPEARLEYIRFATEASRFFRGRREIGFRGDDWRL